MTFSIDLGKAVENIKEDKDKVVRGTLIAITNNIIQRTPVGNPALWKNPPPPGYVGGSLRGAWNASVGAPDRAITGRKQKSAQGEAQVRSAATISALESGQTFYLTNPLPYAQRVEFGWSTQAPAGMLRVSIAEANQKLQQAAR